MNVDKILNKMNKHRQDYKMKGSLGEIAVIEVLKDYQAVVGGIIFHSYMYEYSHRRDGSNYYGNIKYEEGHFIEIEGREYTQDEIDVLFVTDRRIFSIEVKARANKWQIYDHWARQAGKAVDKSPVSQAEKHARHLYHHIYEFIPDGKEEYIVPIVVFVDKSTIKDDRCADMKRYIPVTILNKLKQTIIDNDKPLDYFLDKEEIIKALKGSGKSEAIY